VNWCVSREWDLTKIDDWRTERNDDDLGELNENWATTTGEWGLQKNGVFIVSKMVVENRVIAQNNGTTDMMSNKRKLYYLGDVSVRDELSQEGYLTAGSAQI